MQRLLLVIAVLLLLGYGIFEARRIIEGPEITILSPTNGSATSSDIVTISGTAQNISFLTINDAPAYTDSEGHFEETLSPPVGYTVITVAAVDRFGRRATQTVAFTIVRYCPLSS